MTSETSRGIVRSSELTRFRLAPNPGPMSLDGTNSYLIAAPGAAAGSPSTPGPSTSRTCRRWPARDRSNSS